MRKNTPYKLITIVGPTASGKSSLAIEVAKRYSGEIICADSRTVYRGLDIGSAKPSQKDQHTIKHHLLDVVQPDEPFTVVDFKRLATAAIQEILTRGKLPIFVGGSGLYIDSVLYDYQFPSSDSMRDELNPRHSHKTVPKSQKPLMDGVLIIGLNPGREMLKKRIEERVDAMVADGFIDEMDQLIKNFSNAKALDAPGYKAFRRYINQECTLEEAKQAFIVNDFQLAKRQMGWFKRNKSIQWFMNADEAVHYLDTVF